MIINNRINIKIVLVSILFSMCISIIILNNIIKKIKPIYKSTVIIEVIQNDYSLNTKSKVKEYRDIIYSADFIEKVQRTNNYQFIDVNKEIIVKNKNNGYNIYIENYNEDEYRSRDIVISISNEFLKNSKKYKSRVIKSPIYPGDRVAPVYIQLLAVTVVLNFILSFSVLYAIKIDLKVRSRRKKCKNVQ